MSEKIAEARAVKRSADDEAAVADILTMMSGSPPWPSHFICSRDDHGVLYGG